MKYVTETIGERTIGYELVATNICADNLPGSINEISLLSVDVDMYEATKACLIKASPYVVTGGIIVLEDSPATPNLYGAFLAMEEFLETEEGEKYMKIYKAGHYFLVKK